MQTTQTSDQRRNLLLLPRIRFNYRNISSSEPVFAATSASCPFPVRLLVAPTGHPLLAKATPVGSPFQVLALTRGVRRVRVSS